MFPSTKNKEVEYFLLIYSLDINVRENSIKKGGERKSGKGTSRERERKEGKGNSNGREEGEVRWKRMGRRGERGGKEGRENSIKEEKGGEKRSGKVRGGEERERGEKEGRGNSIKEEKRERKGGRGRGGEKEGKGKIEKGWITICIVKALVIYYHDPKKVLIFPSL